MIFEYGPDDRVPFVKSMLMGIQWAALLLSTIIILGNVVGDIHYSDQYRQILYLRKLMFICSLTLFFQIYAGHRLPLIPGPSAVLLIGIVASADFRFTDIYTSVAAGGLFITLLAVSGLLRHIQYLFTRNVVSVVLLLIAFTIAPTILNLIIDEGSGIPPFYNIGFAFIILLCMLFMHRFSGEKWKPTLIIWALAAGSIAYRAIFPVGFSEYMPDSNLGFSDLFLFDTVTKLTFQPGVFISFIFCYIALLVNDLGSIQSVTDLLDSSNPEKRVNRGVAVTGLANIASGFLGVIGPVNFSVSPGIIISTRCASRYTFVPAALIMLLFSFIPALVSFTGAIPPVIIGTVLAWVMAQQISAGLIMAFKDKDGENFTFESGIVIGLSILLGTIVSFMPPPVTKSLPSFLRPIAGNGFVVGVISSILFDRLLIDRHKGPKRD